jgi:hypothetical protein|nr:hypothetical protein [uncultured Lachnoclostridium sp.]
MDRWEEAKAEREKQQSYSELYVGGIPIPSDFRFDDLDDDTKAELKKEVKAEVMQELDQRIVELTAKIESPKQESTDNLDVLVDVEDTEDIFSNYDMHNWQIDYEKQIIVDKVKEIITEVQPRVVSPYSYLQYPSYISPQQLQEEQKKREDDERKKKEEEQKRKDEEERLKRERSFSTKYKKFKIKVKNHPVSKLLVDVFFWVLIPFVAVGTLYIVIYCFNNETLNLWKALLDYLSVVWGYILEGFDKIQDLKRTE